VKYCWRGEQDRPHGDRQFQSRSGDQMAIAASSFHRLSGGG
jgi:hypothetical protein